MKKTSRLLLLLLFIIMGTTTGLAFDDFGVDLRDANGGIITSDEADNSQTITFGITVNDGQVSRVAADADNAVATISGKTGNNHGLQQFTATVPVDGAVEITMSTCSWGKAVTVKDANGSEAVPTFTTKKGDGGSGCYKGNGDADENVISVKYVGEATTLTISGGAYVGWFSVKAISASSCSVSFSLGDVVCQGTILPTGGTYAKDDKYTIPAQNYTLYKEGYTLTGWTDGTNTYAAGQEITLTSDLALTPVFTENTVSLADRTEETTIKWNFRRDQGAPTVQWQNVNGNVWVAQATIGNQTIDVPITVDTNPGKFNNANNTDWIQINNGTTFTVPSCKDAVVSMEAFNAITTTTIDGQSDYTQGKTISYKIANTSEAIKVVIGDGSYYRYIQVVLPVVQSQGGGESYENVAGTFTWRLSNEAEGTVSEAIAKAIQNASFTMGTGLTASSKTYLGESMTGYQPGTSNAGNVEAVMLEYRVKAKSGLTFKPTNVSYNAVKDGTDNATFSWSYTVDGQESSITTVTKDNIVRNNNTTGTPPMLHSHNINIDGCSEFTFRIYVSGFGNSKKLGINNVIISGTVTGTAANVDTYTLTAVAAPEEGGSVSKYPNADEYEAGSEVTLTATENFGYDFVNWTNAAGEEISNEAKFKYTVTANETLTANFKKVDTYALNLTVDGTNDYMVKISPAPTMVDSKMMYEAGTTVQLQADQYEGLVTFTNWNDGVTNSSKLVSMTEDVNVTAYYAETGIIAGWDFYKTGSGGRKADFASTDNEAAALNLVKTETGETQGWLDKSTEAAGGYESMKGAAVNWRTGASNGDVGNWHWQTKVNAADFQDINVQFQMLYNYNAYQRYNVEFSVDGENWTKVGDISMNNAKEVASFNSKLPAEADNQSELYIRMIADKTSNVAGSASSNDGNALAMFFITGAPKLVNDGIAPILVSSVPANGAEGASATGKIVLTFDERVKVAEQATATLGKLTLTPVVSGKTITFEYKGLEYSTTYDFTLPANSVADLTDNYITEPIAISFTTMVRPSVTKKLYDFIVPDDGTFKEALTAAAARGDQNVRFRIFVKQGKYVIPANQNAKVTGNDSQQYADPKTYFASPNVSIIGESPENTSITNEMPNALSENPDAGANGKANPLEGIRESGVLYLQKGANDTYFQDIKLWSNTADGTGRNVVLVDGGNRTICKNVTLWAYQDTYVSDNAQNLYYFEGGLLRGRTDFLCGSGDVFYNGVTLQMCQDGGYIAVPRNNVKYGYVFKDCTIKGETASVDGNYFLGRPWTEGAEVYFIDTKMEAVPRAIGWAEMSDGGCTRMAEWNSFTANGAQVDLSGRAKTLGKATPNPNNPVLTAEEALEIGNLHNMFGDWDPTLATEQAPVPANVKQNENMLVWDDSNYALLWAVVKDGVVVAFTIEPQFKLTEAGEYAVRAANEMGGLSEMSETVNVTDITTGIDNLTPAISQGEEAIYDLQGRKMVNGQLKEGVYIINGKKVVK